MVTVVVYRGWLYLLLVLVLVVLVTVYGDCLSMLVAGHNLRGVEFVNLDHRVCFCVMVATSVFL